MNVNEVQRRLWEQSHAHKDHRETGTPLFPTNPYASRIRNLMDLMHHPQWLWVAADRVMQRSRNKAPGVDGVTTRMFRKGYEGKIDTLRLELKRGTYQPQPVRQVMIPKANGKMRPLGIPCLRDKIVQEAIRMAIEPIFEVEFHDNSYGFRPNRSTHHAVFRCQNLMKHGFTWVIEGDVKACFDEISHKAILKVLREKVHDNKFLDLIRRFLKAGVEVKGVVEPTEKGVPEGGVISPLLANAVLNKLDWFLHGKGAHDDAMVRAAHHRQPNVRFVRYADDWCVFITRASRRYAETLREQIREFLDRECGLRLSVEKTHVTHVRDGSTSSELSTGRSGRSVPKIKIGPSPSSGSIITVAGLDSNIRGQHHTKLDGQVVRPSLVILDDPQTRQSAASRTQTKHRLDILNGDVLGMAGPNVKIAGFMTCTKIHHDDLADQILDQQKHPEWQGEATKLVYAFPTDEKRWDKYAQLRAEGLREGDAGKRATAFYAKHREAMDAGAEVAWPQRHHGDELSAIQHAMNLKLRDEEAFFAEYQNEPLSAQFDEDVLTPDQVANQISGRPRGQVPKPATCLTAYVDVQEKMLFYVVAAWESDFTGHIVDYGTLPDQQRRYFTLRDSTKTLAAAYGGGVEGAVQAGLERLAGQLLTREWSVTGDGGVMRIERLLIDAGYLPGIIENVCHKVGAVAMPAKGVGIKAGNKPMHAYRRKTGERHGHHWYVPNVSRTAELRHVRIDTNHWKSFVHGRFATAPGDRGSLTLFGTPGRSAAEHRLFADHVAASETWTRTEGHGRLVQEWTIKPGKPDNHWFDCLVGCAVAASMCGVRFGVERPEVESPQMIRLSDLQKARR